MSAPTASTSTTFTSNTSSTAPPRISLDTEETEDFDPGYGLASFDAARYTPSRPSTAGGKQTPDSPTLGSAHVSPVIGGKLDRGAEQSDSEGERRRRSRFVEEMGTPATSTDTMEAPYFRPSSEQQAGEGASASAAATSSSSPPSTSHAVNPATIPIRTSSSNAVSNAEKQSSWRESSYIPTSPTKKKHRSMMSVPEEKKRHSQRAAAAGPSTTTTDEHDWLAQTHRHSTSNGNGHPHDRGRETHEFRSPNQYPSTTFSQQPTLYTPASVPAPTNPDPSHQNPPPQPPNNPASTPSPLVTPTSWSQEKESILRAPYTYLDAHPGKDLRTHLITAFNAWLRVPEPSLAIITKVVGMLHTASLLIDDVEDSSVLRRGVPVAHKIFGAAQTINCANYIYFCALRELGGLRGVPGGGGGSETAVGIYTEELLNLHRGQGMDLFWRDTLTCPSEDDYLEMVGNKTGGLFRLAVRLMCSESPSHNASRSSQQQQQQQRRPGSSEENDTGQAEEEKKTDYIPLVNTIGLLFQILDDYLNLASPTYTSHKGLCEDLTEGKFSFPIIHSIRSDPTNLTLINILKQRTEDDDVKRWAVGYMEGTTGSFAYTRRVLRGLTRKAVGLVGEVDVSVLGAAGGGRGGGREEEGELGDGVRRILEGLGVEGQRGSRGGV
ncbi:hypothetical protein B0A55_07775 [Friedmanniomyces simplex]|uniref:Geranylgeranyl pyrophosphate synthase n=1 Tax=Friedmanniomyces simplex TaxID=329884 RepID=A0A4U0X9C5_9PEZI|nr:hypothetical protein B0A55_07775 [Friedmanniomyces simplex]